MLDSFLGVVNQVWNDGLYGIGITELGDANPIQTIIPNLINHT